MGKGRKKGGNIYIAEEMELQALHMLGEYS